MNRKLGLLLIPLVPLSAIGLVSIVDRMLPAASNVVIAPQCEPTLRPPTSS